MLYRRTYVLAGCIAMLILMLMLGAPLVRQCMVGYHLWRLNHAWENMTEVGVDVTDAVAAYEHHLRQLRILGYFFHERYEFDNLSEGPEVHRWLWQQIVRAFPDNRHVTLSYPNNVLEVWDIPARRDDWDRFFVETNCAEAASSASTQRETGTKEEGPDKVEGRTEVEKPNQSSVQPPQSKEAYRPMGTEKAIQAIRAVCGASRKFSDEMLADRRTRGIQCARSNVGVST